MNVPLMIMIALAILVPPKGTREVRFHQRQGGTEYVGNVEYILQRKTENGYTLNIYDRTPGAAKDKLAAPALSVTVVSEPQCRFLITPADGKTHPYMHTPEQDLQLAKLIEIPTGGDFRNAATLKQVLFPEADGLIRLHHEGKAGQLVAKWPTYSSDWVLSCK